MEAGFMPGSSPLGEDCPGWAVAQGWQAFLAPGTPASSCFNENKNPANVYRGQRSQEITFDFVSAEAGIYRQVREDRKNKRAVFTLLGWGFCTIMHAQTARRATTGACTVTNDPCLSESRYLAVA